MNPLFRQIRDVLKTYLKTQFVIMLTVALAVWMILSAIGVRFPLILGIITGALATIPIVGMISAALIAATVATLDNLRFLPQVPEIVEGCCVFGIFLLLNLLIDYLVGPYITGKLTNIHPIVTLVSVLLGSALFGIVGAILAVPALLVILTILNYSAKRSHP